MPCSAEYSRELYVMIWLDLLFVIFWELELLEETSFFVWNRLLFYGSDGVIYQQITRFLMFYFEDLEGE